MLSILIQQSKYKQARLDELKEIHSGVEYYIFDEMSQKTQNQYRNSKFNSLYFKGSIN